MLKENFFSIIEIIMKNKFSFSSLVCLNCLLNNEYKLFDEQKNEVHKLIMRATFQLCLEYPL
jgi:hypothetical protein